MGNWDRWKKERCEWKREKEGRKSRSYRKSAKKRETGIKRAIEKPERQENEREEQKCEGWDREIKKDTKEREGVKMKPERNSEAKARRECKKERERERQKERV